MIKNTWKALVVLVIFVGFVIFINLQKNNKSIIIVNRNKIDKITKNENSVEKNNNFTKKVAYLLFGGDIMLDRTVRQNINVRGAEYFTQDIKDLFTNKDIVMVNMEGPITDNISVSNVPQDNPAHFKFTFDPNQTKEFLNFNNINAVSIGNNHILNFGVDGVAQTRHYLEDNNVLYVGVPDENAKSVVYEYIKDRKVAFLSYNDFAPPSIEKTIANIKEAKQNSDFVIVFAHWGQEYNKKITPLQQQQARQLIDAGAKVIIGAHPHVIEPVEEYGDGIVFYSLGNFIFDQFFDEDVKERLLVHMLIDKNDNLEFILTPIYTGAYGKLELADEVRKKNILKEMSDNSVGDENLKQQIVDGQIKLK